ncbi:MAG: glutamate-5-semialdehyde dehydrogenase [Rickettsiales bacterium]
MGENIPALISDMGLSAVGAKRVLAAASDETRSRALREMAACVRAQKASIAAANARDMEGAKERGLSKAAQDRLALNDDRMEAMARGLEAIADRPDPLGKILEDRTVAHNGLRIKRVSVPIGVIGVIYEARPNVTADAAGLCVKSGNACILRGGSESFYSCQAVHAALEKGLENAGLPKECAQFVPTPDREAVGALLRMADCVDLIVPRGGKSLCERVANESKVPTLLHLDGVCSTYIDASANIDMAIKVAVNAKMRRTGICGATENILFDKALPKESVCRVISALIEKGCAVRADDAVTQACRGLVVAAANDHDWGEEYLDAVISAAVVDGVKGAASFIARYGSAHTDAIIAENPDAAEYFFAHVDSAIVMHNASTQFADGGEFGLGAEIGIATGRLHARGPVGADQLTTYKYIVIGDGACRP